MNYNEIEPDQVIWSLVKDQARIGVHMSSGMTLAQMVYDGVSYTGSGVTSNAALRDLCQQIENALNNPQSLN